jgi:large subunit ribosomal protein L1
MPNPKTGTVTMAIGQAISEIKKGKISYRVDKDGNLNISVARCSFADQDIIDNILVVCEAIARSRPAAVKGAYMMTCVAHTTMGPGLKLTFDQKN